MKEKIFDKNNNNNNNKTNSSKKLKLIIITISFIILVPIIVVVFSNSSSNILLDSYLQSNSNDTNFNDDKEQSQNPLSLTKDVQAQGSSSGNGNNTNNQQQFNLEDKVNEENYFATASTTRLAGDDYYSTAVAISQIIYPAINDYTRPNAVILVPVNNPAVGLTSVGIIHHPIDSPILYTDTDKLPSITKEEIKRLKPDGIPVVDNAQIMMIGNISDTVYDELSKEMGLKIFRITGKSPIDVSANVDEFMSTMHTDHRDEIMIANLDHLDYALYAQAWNAHMGHGFLYVTDEGIPEPTRKQLEKRYGGAYLYLLGDEKVIPKEIADELAQYGHITRIPGTDPYGMSARFAGFKDMGNNYGFWIGEMARNFGWGLQEAGHNYAFVNPEHPQDAIPAAILSHRGKHGPMLLIEKDNIPKSVESYLQAVQPSLTDSREQLFNHGWIIGPPSHISIANQAKIDSLLSFPIPQSQQLQQQPSFQSSYSSFSQQLLLSSTILDRENNQINSTTAEEMQAK